MLHIIEGNVSALVCSLFLLLFSNNNVESFFFFELTARSVVIVDFSSLIESVCSGMTRCAGEPKTQTFTKG